MTEDKKDVRQQAKDAAEHLKYSKDEDQDVDYDEQRKVSDNFKLGRDPDAESYKGTDAAYDALQEKAKERRDDTEADAESQKRAARDDVSARITHVAERTTAEKGALEQERQQLMTDMSSFQNTAAGVNARWSQLDELQQHQLTQMATQGKATLQRRADALREKMQTHSAQENVVRGAAAQGKFFDIVPELKDEATRAEFVKDMSEKHGVPESTVKSVTDPTLVTREFRAWQADKKTARQAHLDRPRKTTYTSGPLAKGGAMPSKMTVAEAESRMKATGSMQDALNYLALKGEQAKEASRG